MNSKGLYRSKFRKRKRKSLSCVYVLLKTLKNWALSSLSRATTANECTNKRDAHTKLLSCLSKPFEVCRSDCRRRRPARCLSSLKNPDTETVLCGNRFPAERSQIRIEICVFENVWICVRDMVYVFC